MFHYSRTQPKPAAVEAPKTVEPAKPAAAEPAKPAAAEPAKPAAAAPAAAAAAAAPAPAAPAAKPVASAFAEAAAIPAKEPASFQIDVADDEEGDEVKVRAGKGCGSEGVWRNLWQQEHNRHVAFLIVRLTPMAWVCMSFLQAGAAAASNSAAGGSEEAGSSGGAGAASGSGSGDDGASGAAAGARKKNLKQALRDADAKGANNDMLSAFRDAPPPPPPEAAKPKEVSHRAPLAIKWRPGWRS